MLRSGFARDALLASAVMATEPALEATDPFDRDAQTFPRLSEEMTARIAAYGEEVAIVRGDHLFDRGQRGVDFFLVLQGSIEIIDLDTHGVPHVIHVHRERNFTGEMDLFNRRRILVSGRAAEDSRVVRIRPAAFRRMVASESDIGEIVMRAFILRRVGFIRHQAGGVVLIGAGHAGDMQRLQRFMERNGYPHRVLDVETDPDASGFLDCFALADADLPVVITPDHQVFRNPGNGALADALGLTETFDAGRVYDVAVIGAGPAGLAAAVYAASEGLETLVVEGLAPGGQAGTSSKIENYLGFPTGISGQALAGRAQAQAQKFGARLAISRMVVELDCTAADARGAYRLRLEDGQTVEATAVVVATGARYRKLDVPDYERFEGQGIHYAATAMEAGLCVGEDVVVVGGGNSAGQAAVFLARQVRHVHVLIRGAALAATMSDYLVRRIESSRNITLHVQSEITRLVGDRYLSGVEWTDRRDGAVSTHPSASLFVMIGAEPNTGWLDGCLALDDQGFVITGHSADGRSPVAPYATSLPGVFAVGDVRAGSVKRVASAVGEGSVVVQAIHRYLHPVA